MREGRSRKRGALLACLWVYLAALGAAGGAVALLRGGHPVFTAFIADLLATMVVFLFSMAFDNSSLYDPYWSVVPPLIALYWLAAAGEPASLTPRRLAALLLTALWATRLTFNWARNWRGMEHEDWRYRGFRERYGALYWPVSFFGIHLMPTLLVFLGSLSLYAVMASGPARPLGLIDALAAALTLAAVAVEAAADRQLHRFRREAGSSGKILSRGLWAHCRHPNYLGEILFWWGLYMFCLAANPGRWWFILGPAAITGLFVGISVPMMDRRLLAGKPGYAEHMRKVPALIPRLIRRPRLNGEAAVHRKSTTKK
jgi:steroid 5-alpha reductase family enzyme